VVVVEVIAGVLILNGVPSADRIYADIALDAGIINMAKRTYIS